MSCEASNVRSHGPFAGDKCSRRANRLVSNGLRLHHVCTTHANRLMRDGWRLANRTEWEQWNESTQREVKR